MLNIRLMRSLDQTAGSLVCSAFAVAHSLTRPFRKEPASFEKIAVMKFFGIGSIVVASPALQALREAYPDAKIIFVSFSGNREILEILKLTDENIVDNSSIRAFATSALKAAAALYREGVDLAIDLEFFAKFPLILSSLAMIPTKAGFYLTLEPWRRSLLDVRGYYNHYFHTKDIFTSLVYLLKTKDEYYLDFDAWRERFRYPRFKPTAIELQRVRAALRERGFQEGERIIVLNPNTSVELAPETRKWPEERYAELARRIAEEYDDVRVVFIGAKSEKEYVERIVRAADHPSVVSAAGALGLRELLALFSHSSLVVTNDSGPMHLACLVDVPIVGLFFAETPTLFAPIAERVATVAPPLYSIPLYTVYTGKNRAPMQNVAARLVSVDRVLSLVRDQLEAPEGAQLAGVH